MPIKLSLSLITASVIAWGVLLFWSHIPLSQLSTLSFYTDMANPSVRIIQVQPGDRKEQIADTLAENLGWTSLQKYAFTGTTFPSGLNIGVAPDNLEGHYFPSTYLINKNATPGEITDIMTNKFDDELATVSKPRLGKVINDETALTIASIIQREAAGPQDMPVVSGIIWNRLFAGMKLQIDATVQYAIGSEGDWWPQITPDDTSVNSPYNTYKHSNLPPTPISNPSLAAIQAAYNPAKTSCIFYIHDKNHVIHCSATYQGQLANIQKYY